MRIYSKVTNQEAYLVKDQHTGRERYDCYLQHRPNNEKAQAHSFENLKDAAIFLLNNPGTGIRMNPGSAIVSENLVIELD